MRVANEGFSVLKTCFSSSYTPKRVVLYVIWRRSEAESYEPLLVSDRSVTVIGMVHIHRDRSQSCHLIGICVRSSVPASAVIHLLVGSEV